jgi:hypothetical protein
VAESSRAWIELWPVAVLAVAAPAVPIAFSLANPPPALPAPIAGYPIRFALPLASPPSIGNAPPAVEFDLAGSGAAGEAGGSVVEVRKTVRFNGADAGSATIQVGADSTLAISADELHALLSRAGRGELAEQLGARAGAERFLGFAEMRAQGIDVRYDIESDRIVIGG